MKYLCVLFALSILIFTAYAAPTKSESQKSVKLQGWGALVGHTAPIAFHYLHNHGSEKSFQEKAMVEIQDDNKYLDAFRGAVDGHLNHNGAVKLQGWGAVAGKLAGTLGPMLYDYINNHQSLLKKLEKVALEQDGDIMAAIENLPEKEKAQAQFLGTLSALLTAGSLAHDLING